MRRKQKAPGQFDFIVVALLVAAVFLGATFLLGQNVAAGEGSETIKSPAALGRAELYQRFISDHLDR